MNFENVTIVNVDGRLDELAETQYALVHSGRQMPGARLLLLSPRRPKILLDGIEHQCIAPMGYLEYSLFIIYALHRFIETDFALIVQNDGWVLGGQNWRPEFFDYDYIGAPIHFARIRRNTGNTYYNGFAWVPHLGDPDCRIDIVMNGGFSLRSRRFLEAPSRLALPFQIPAVSNRHSSPYKLHWDTDSTMEDVHLCIDMRDRLEAAGMKYAPLDVAKHFAFEHLHPVLHQESDLSRVFGHHSRLRRMVSDRPLTVRFEALPEQLTRVYGEARVVKLFESLGYRMEFRAAAA